MARLSGKAAIVTGAASGIGRASAELFAAEGAGVLAVDLRAVFRLTREAIPHLIRSPAGRIISTASVMAEHTDYGLAAYCAAKAGVVGLTRTLALELGKHAVTANAILPGAIRTGMTQQSFSDPRIADIWARKSVLRRLGEPIDVARLALFLASDDSAFVTGQAIAADGGLTLRT